MSRRAAAPPVDTVADARRTDLRLARLHLRMRLLPLARAEFETLAATGPLDPGALGDLAEVRWRSGDLAGAGDAAAAHLESGGGEGRALAIAAEAAAAIGRTAEAGRLATRALDRLDGSLDDLFAGMPKRAVWPIASTRVAVAAVLREPMEELEAARVALAEGRSASAAIRLALVLRMEPSLAPAILDLIADRSGPAFGVVRGDAYRIVGREVQAQEAFAAVGVLLDDEAPGAGADPAAG
ncbi:MAG: hypothetical protein AABZ33_12900 [Chloroflexota bacterium]